jgi:uncharacterized RDD family membrane protein YckC
MRRQAEEPNLSSTSPGDAPENKVHVAGLWQRLAAAAVDALLLAPILLAVGWLAIEVTGARLPAGNELRVEMVFEVILQGGGLPLGLSAVGLVIILVYGGLFMGTTGATPGLRLLRLRVITVYGESLEWWRVVLRCGGFLVSLVLLGLGFLWIGFDREKRGLPDWVAGTYVIRNGRPEPERPAPATAMDPQES